MPLPCFHREIIGAVLLVMLTAGCHSDPAPQGNSTASAPEPSSWEQQLQHVRDGATTAIRADTQSVSPQQWEQLREGCEALTILEADASRLTAGDLALLANLPNLQRLKLTGPIGDAAMPHISAATNLTVLNLPDSELTDQGLAQLEALRQLELLRFGSPRVTDAGLEVVTRLPALRFLHLIDVPVTDEGLTHLHSLSQLESFYLDGGRCTDEGLYALLEALPGLHFHRDQLHLPDDPHKHPHEDSTSDP